MKSIQMAILLVAATILSNAVMAQGHNVPQPVLTAFQTRYSSAIDLRWKTDKDGYTAKFRLDGHKYAALYSLNGTWVETSSRIKWPWHLPKAVKDSLKNSPHGGWHTYAVNSVENAQGKFYRIEVDNTNYPIDAQHQLVLTEDWQIDLRADGHLVAEQDITNKPF